MQDIILHLDMNSYFASVIQQDKPEFRGKPLGVCEHLGGIIIGASIEAKKWGITTGTPVWEARKLYPKIILTHTTAERFRFYTRRLIKLVSEYTDSVEVYSIDEVFLDLTRTSNIRRPGRGRSSGETPEDRPLGSVDPFEEAVKIAQEIKRRMKAEVGDWLTCSIGIAENKVLAKIGSDLKKPDGIVVIRNQKLQNYHNCDNFVKNSFLQLTKEDLYHRLKLTDVPGIGNRQEKNLNGLGIKTLLDLKNYSKSHLISRFGRIMGHHLYNLGQLAPLENSSLLKGLWLNHQSDKLPMMQDNYEDSLTGWQSTWKADVYQESDIKSIGHMYTLPKEYRKMEYFAPVLYKLCEMVGRRLRRKQLEGNVLHFFFYDKNYSGFGRSQKLGDFISDGREIFLEASSMLFGHNLDSATDQRPPKADQRPISGIKLIGVTVANLRPISGQLSLFGHREKNQSLTKALDKINEKYGDFTVARAKVMAAGKVFRDSVGFGRVKEL